ncbi:hypothetical protein [Leptolyngbya ohadii]|uniref:hypothetical protein n=1 Tax=Leptolyngbya ohadii TaxID=1962290 RepID=UPI000B59E542|nr:hypothetical protein [Leptolyngbya ohadii]
MSEPNFPLKPQAEPELESSLEWWNPFPELTETEASSEQAASSSSSDEGIDASSLSAASAEVPEIVFSTSGEASATAPLQVSQLGELHEPALGDAAVEGISASEISDPLTASSEPPSLIDLISLIQELNQCNGVLLDRVSQLEDALERSQKALQEQIGRSPEPSDMPENDDPAAAHAQIANLFSQLEFAHQTNQRQQIVIETLTAGLENSQERVAQLEREAALLQQRYSEQTQLLMQSEGTCRDLQARLQRQQRYTLQFKAALEKCLEMPMPHQETGSDMIAAPIDSLLLPKAQQIQPWSKATAPQDSLLPWMKRFKDASNAFLNAGLDADEADAPLSDDQLSDDQLSETAFAAALDDLDSNISAEAIASIEPPTPSRMSAVQLPMLNAPNATASSMTDGAASQEFVAELVAEHAAESNEAIEPTSPAPASSISYDLKPQAGNPASHPAGHVNPALLNHLDAVVQPLADRLAEALLSQGGTADIVEPEPIQTEAFPAPVPMPEGMVEATVEDSVIVSDPDSLLASALSEAEDALWRDLAQLMDVSSEEAIKASLTGDLTAFESLNFGSAAATGKEEAIEAVSPATAPAQQSFAQPGAVNAAQIQGNAAQPQSMPESELPAAAAEMPAPQVPARSPEIAATQFNSPSPLLHPFRPTKPKRSLSSVELPSFLRQEETKPLPT